jgi:hypothetical protein
MALYTFYLCHDDGVAPTFEMRDAQADGQALALAELVLEQHSTADFANVWIGDRLVGRVDRYQERLAPFDGLEA